PGGLPLRLACRSLGAWPEPQRRMALLLRGGLAPLERAERGATLAEASAGASLRPVGQAAPAFRRGRSSRAALRGLARSSREAMARASPLLRPAQPPGHQPRRACREMCPGGAIPHAAGIAQRRLLAFGAAADAIARRPRHPGAERRPALSLGLRF